MNNKPLGRKNYGSIGHLPGSRVGKGDHYCQEGQAKIATVEAHPMYTVFVQEKLDGSNVGVARVNDDIIPLTRKGHRASTSPYLQHHMFDKWVQKNKQRFLTVLKNEDRVVGEWLIQAHGTRYKMRPSLMGWRLKTDCASYEPFIAFDIMTQSNRVCYDEFMSRVDALFITPHLLHRGSSFSVEQAEDALGLYGHHWAIDPAEGAVWRVESRGNSGRGKPKVVFLAKYVRPSKVNDKYLPIVTGESEIWNAKL